MSRGDARDRLIQAAIDLIWTSSYGAVSVDAICERAQVRKGSFYHFFASKDDLVVAALDTHWSSRRPVLDDVFSASRAPLERLQRYFTHIGERQGEVRGQYGRVLGCFHHAVGSECVQRPTAVAAKAQEISLALRRYIESAVRDAQAEGALPSGDPVAAAKGLFAYVTGALAQARVHDDLELLRQLPQTAWLALGMAGPPKPGA
ncbi:TetR/AcrR family transcriptional regulator [Nannocystis punicea]|uniref:TetR/AcrR family transcriptional regulator n=1 Tax=Nannocystis punicea TaxID=2995304 RepID=A0ABY7HD19_9BACT|nr:TetR/AcrR family transcriptional regulator [Nannocystis poenicansa]WAS96919.1 TetR/AcrR family transcriptional regulator [Nannocystis poenicansa]